MITINPDKRAIVERDAFKAGRKAAVDAIKVEVDGMEFDGDERSQERMSRAIVSLKEGEVVLWVLANNRSVEVTKAQLLEALRLAGKCQTELWLMV